MKGEISVLLFALDDRIGLAKNEWMSDRQRNQGVAAQGRVAKQDRGENHLEKE
jgi:hypothetical protein